jgi:hypothetical protein
LEWSWIKHNAVFAIGYPFTKAPDPLQFSFGCLIIHQTKLVPVLSKKQSRSSDYSNFAFIKMRVLRRLEGFYLILCYIGANKSASSVIKLNSLYSLLLRLLLPIGSTV